ncbi:uncharacterized protein LOC135845475 [Planococcus citri]|uniref:uncharacterized protein LOC135845475 n=1 Tax=Planococcus citri TaxID=170843 RepID=UPI0031FA3C76
MGAAVARIPAHRVTIEDVDDLVKRYNNNPHQAFTSLEMSLIYHAIDISVPCPRTDIDYSGVVRYHFSNVVNDINCPLNLFTLEGVSSRLQGGRHPCRWLILLKFRNPQTPYNRNTLAMAKRTSEMGLTNLMWNKFTYKRIEDQGECIELEFRMAHSTCQCAPYSKIIRTPWIFFPATRTEEEEYEMRNERFKRVSKLRLERNLGIMQDSLTNSA